MKSSAYAVSRMKPMYQARKNSVPGSTKDLLRRTSSWNSGDASMARQSISPARSGCVGESAMSPPRSGGTPGTDLPLCAALTLFLARGRMGAAFGGLVARGARLRLRLGLGRRAAAAAALLPDLLLGGPRPRLARLPGGRRAVGPAAEQQHRHRAEPERLDDRERAQDRQHDKRTADDAQHPHKAREQAHAHRVEADHHPA